MRVRVPGGATGRRVASPSWPPVRNLDARPSEAAVLACRALALVLILSLPVTLPFLVFQRDFVKGLASGALKG